MPAGTAIMTTTSNMFLSLKSLFHNSNNNNNSTASHLSKIPARTTPPRKIICETLIEELEYQIKETEDYLKEIRKKKNDDLGRPDYTWLMDPQKAYRLPQITRLEIEDVSRLLEPDDVCGIIKDFRSSISYDVPVDKLHSYLKFIITSHIQTKKKQANSNADSNKYKQIGIFTLENHSVPERSQSSAILKKPLYHRKGEIQRPQSAPLSSNWKKRVKVHPTSGLAITHTDNCYIELGDNANLDVVLETTDQQNGSTSIV